jgi:heterodisulfide reductase subunit A-like polyferredoxin
MRTGVFFCPADGSRNFNTDAIAKYSANLPDVETVQIMRPDSRPDVKFICEQIRSNNLERIVIAGDMPGTRSKG